MAENLIDMAIGIVITDKDYLTHEAQVAVVDTLAHIYNEAQRALEMGSELDTKALVEFLDSFTFQDWKDLDLA